MSGYFSTACCKTRTDLLRLEKEIKLPNQNYKQIRITDPKRGENYNHINNLDQSQHELIKITQSELEANTCIWRQVQRRKSNYPIRGPFLERPGNVSDAKANFKIKPC